MKEQITEQDPHKAFNRLGKNASNLEIVEAATEDLRERQYHAEIASGSTPEEAALVSGWKPKE